MLCRIPRPKRSKAPRRTYPLFTHFQDLNGRPTLSVWWDTTKTHPSLPPLFSFQVYVMHKASPVDKADREALASDLFRKILGDWHGYSSRIDLHFMRPGEKTADCVESHRSHVQAKPTNLARVVVPAYTCWYSRPSHSFIYVVFAQDWKKEGLKGVCFDYDSSRPGIPADAIREKHLVNDEMERTADDYCAEWCWKDDYEEIFGEARDAGMTDWQEVFKAANRLGMDQW
ncbi:uncharacterized protein BKA78DRAFT_355198 [Phyllosticta capitalensis]|uniref:uncharacterized protein n=1 Tax=Phyllosticta capitalensis TaxID=121624 RepID=UPI0031311D3C